MHSSGGCGVIMQCWFCSLVFLRRKPEPGARCQRRGSGTLLQSRQPHHLLSVDLRSKRRNQRRAAPVVIPFRRRIPMPTSYAVNESFAPSSGTTTSPSAGAAGNNGTAAARTMLDLFASVGATRFNVSWIRGYHEPRRPRTLRKSLDARGEPKTGVTPLTSTPSATATSAARFLPCSIHRPASS
jgi:hypothetical protein